MRSSHGAAPQRDHGAQVQQQRRCIGIGGIVNRKAVDDADEVGRAVGLKIDALTEDGQRDIRTACHAHRSECSRRYGGAGC